MNGKKIKIIIIIEFNGVIEEHCVKYDLNSSDELCDEDEIKKCSVKFEITVSNFRYFTFTYS